MKVAIDGITFSHPQPGGYRTYAKNLISHLLQTETGCHFLLFVDRPDFGAISLSPDWDICIVPSSLPWVGVAIREQFGLTLALRKHGADIDILHSLAATGPVRHVPGHIVTLYDTIEFTTPLPNPLVAPRFWAMRVYSRFVQSVMATKAVKLITISEFARQQIVNRFVIPENRVSVTHLGISEVFRNAPQRLEQLKGQLPGQIADHKYILALASASPRKNIDRLIISFSFLPTKLRQLYPLVLVCSHPVVKSTLVAKAEAVDVLSEVIFLDQVSDETLAALYLRASLFVFPSLEEGFGLPPLEAMACRTPVIASNTSSMPEVLGNGALLVTPKEPKIVAEAMAAVLTNPQIAEELAERGWNWSRSFSWERTAKETLEIYRTVVYS